MRLPYHRYLLYLALTKHTDQETRSLIQLATGRDVSTAYLTKIRDNDLYRIADPILNVYMHREDLNPIIKLHRDDVPLEWVNKLNLTDAHYNTEQFRRAYSIFSNQFKFHYVNLYLLCQDTSPDKILSLYSKRFNETLELNDLLVYVSYFADFESMKSADWESFLLKLEPKWQTKYKAAPGRKIPYIQWRLGDKVDITPDTVNQTIMANFFHLSNEECDLDSPQRDGWAERASKFASIAMAAADRVKSHEKPANTVRSLMMVLQEKAEQFADYSKIDTGSDSEEPPDPGTDPESDSDDSS